MKFTWDNLIFQKHLVYDQNIRRTFTLEIKNQALYLPRIAWYGRVLHFVSLKKQQQLKEEVTYAGHNIFVQL